MDRLWYFINKAWILLTSIDPLVWLALIVLFGILFFPVKYLIVNKIKPSSSKKNLVTSALTLFVIMPIICLIVFVIFLIKLSNQPF
jgi:hypothetical protein